MHIGITEHGIKPFQCLGGLCKHDYAADRTVQPVRQAHEYLARLGVALRYERLICFRKRLVGSLVTLDNLPHLLVHNKQMIVLIKYPRSEIVELAC